MTMKYTKLSLHKKRGLRPTDPKQVRRILVDTIKCQTGINIVDDAKRFFNDFDHTVKCRGIRQAVLDYKSIYHTALNSMLKQDNPQYSFLATKRGFPRRVYYLKKYSHTPQGKQAVLSLLSWYRGIVAPGIPSFVSITKEGIEVPLTTINSIKAITKALKVKVDVKALLPQQVTLRTKRGPNGQATLSCLLDLQALPDNLYDSIVKISEMQGGDDFIDTLEELRDATMDLPENPLIKHSRLAIKREGGGKDRVFAIADYWTQATLNPLHTKLSQILKSIPNDCTWDQGKGVPTIKAWTASRSDLYSYDLSSATDRFPIQLQQAVLETITSNEEYAAEWSNLMTNREFHYKGKTYKWAVGQPLGAYSSWPMFALTHHLVVMMCAQKAKVAPTYYLLGDDIVIAGSKLAKTYKDTMISIGVEINQSKSLVGCQAEFAKRIFHRGCEISPAPVKMLHSLVRDPILIGEVCNHLLDKASNVSCFKRLRCSAVKTFSALVCRSDHRELLILASNPLTGWLKDVNQGDGASFRQEGNHRNVPWELLSSNQTKQLYQLIKYKYLMKQYKLMSKQVTDSIYSDKLKHVELPGTTPVSNKIHPIHTIKNSMYVYFKDAHRAIGKYWTSLTRNSASKDSILNPLPKLKAFSIENLTSSRRSRIKHNAKVILDLASACYSIGKAVEEIEERHALSAQDMLNIIDSKAKSPSNVKDVDIDYTST